MPETKCYKCGKDIYFDKNFKAKNNKFIPLQKDTKKPHRCQNSDNEKLKPKEIPSHIEYLIGCDEAGTGETFGSMFLGCVLVDSMILCSHDVQTALRNGVTAHSRKS